MSRRCVVKKVVCIQCSRNENKKALGFSVARNKEIEGKGHEFEYQPCHILAFSLCGLGQTRCSLQALVSKL